MKITFGKKHNWWPLAVLFIIVVTFLFFKEDFREITNHPSGGSSIVFFGDSLVYGVGSNKGGGFVKILEERYTGYEVINAGVSGDTTADGLERIDDVEQYDPKVVLIALGGNDFIRRRGEDETKRNLERIVVDVLDMGAVVVLLGEPGYANIYKDVALKHGTFYTPNILKGMLTKPDVMYDPIHPNDNGYLIIANRIEPILDEALGKR